MAVAAFAAVCLLAAGAVAWWVSGTQVGESVAYLRELGPVLPALCVVAAVGVIWLGWRASALAGGIASTAAWLKNATPDSPKPTGGPLLQSLVAAIDNALARCSERNTGLDDRLRDLQIQAQIAQRQQRNTEAVLHSIRDAVIVIDEFGKLVLANESAARLFGFDPASSRHKPLAEVIGPDYGQFVEFVLHGKNSKGRATRREMEFSSDGTPRVFDCVLSCVFDRNDHVCGAAAVLHDVTREKEISQMKNDFVSHVSHELKTPLASITAYSEMLADGEATDEQTRKEFYSVIQAQAKRLNRLIEDILNISRIESGLIKVNKEPASLTMLIAEQLDMIKAFAEEKNVTVIGQKPIVFDHVLVDKDMISQVIVNLLSNAVKYTPSGGTVKIETQVDEIAGLARVTVTDTGVGIPDDEIEHVFDKFYRVGANKKQAKGTGLGLNLVKQIVEKVHGGKVFVTSRLGHGSTFGFELPLAKTEPAPAT